MRKFFIMLCMVIMLGGCNLFQTETNLNNPMSIDVTPDPVNISRDIKEMKENIGDAPVPRKIVKDGVTYIAFTENQMKKLVAKNVLSNHMEEIIELQYEQAKLYVIEINQLKEIIRSQEKKLNTYKRLLEATESDINKEKVEGYVYKVLTIGQLAVILLLLM